MSLFQNLLVLINKKKACRYHVPCCVSMWLDLNICEMCFRYDWWKGDFWKQVSSFSYKMAIAFFLLLFNPKGIWRIYLTLLLHFFKMLKPVNSFPTSGPFLLFHRSFAQISFYAISFLLFTFPPKIIWRNYNSEKYWVPVAVFLSFLFLHSSEVRMHTILDWATCGKCSKPRCFEVLASDFHWASPQNFSGAWYTRTAFVLTNKMNWANVLTDKILVNTADVWTS